MEEKMKQAKNQIAILTENILYSRIRALNSDGSINEEMRNEIRNEMIDVFVEENTERFKELSPEQIKEHVEFVLNRTIENMKRQKEDSER